MAIKCQHKIIHLVDRYVKDINEAQDVAQETQTQPELKDNLDVLCSSQSRAKNQCFFMDFRGCQKLCVNSHLS